MAVLVRFTLLIALTLSFVSFGEEVPSSNKFNSYWSEFSSPWKTDAKYILLGGVGLAIFLREATPDFVTSTQNTWSQDKPFREYSKYGDYFGQGIPNILYVLGMGTHYYYSKSETSVQRSLFMLKTTLYSTVLTHSMKLIWHESRPDDPEQRDSFPSGHTTAAFAFASSIGMEHGIYWGTLSYLAATYTGFSRINDNRHWLNDVVAGAAIGISYGVGLYQHLHAGDKSESASAFMVLPSDDLSGATATYWRSY